MQLNPQMESENIYKVLRYMTETHLLGMQCLDVAWL